MAIDPDSDTAAAVVIFENDPRQANAYQELFTGAGYLAQTALPNQDVQQLCERLKPQVILFDMAIWEADTAYFFTTPHRRLIAVIIFPHLSSRRSKNVDKQRRCLTRFKRRA